LAKVLINVNPYPEQSTVIKLSYIDIGGQKHYHRIRKSQLNDSLPLSIILFLDHRALDRINDIRGKDGEQIDDGKLDPERIKRHHEVFAELIDIFRDDRELRSICRAFIICINKYDLWRDHVKKDEFLKEFEVDISELMDVSGIRKVPELIPCSIKSGEGIYDVLHTILRLSGWEIVLPWGWKIRPKTGVIG
jgi:GTPase SAR1 family protein